MTIDSYIPLVDGPKVAAPFNAPNWFWQHWRTLALIGFGFAALIVLRGSGRLTSAAEESNELRDITDPADSMHDTHPPDMAVHRSHHDPSFETQRDGKLARQVDRWCRENPDAAAETIRKWLDRAG